MATLEYIGASIATYKAIVIQPGDNIDLLTDSEFRIGLGQYMLSFIGWDAEAVAAAWTNSINPLFREITCTADNGNLTFTHQTLGQDFELTVTIDGQESSIVSSLQKIAFSPTPSGGTFTLTDGTETTGTITWSATPATLITNITNAINALTAYNSGDVTVTHVGGEYFLDFSTGEYAGLPVPSWSGTFTSLTGGNANVTINTTQNGNAGQHEIFEIDFPGDGTHTENLNDIQLLTPADNTEGTFKLALSGIGITTDIPYNAGRSVIQNKLEKVLGPETVKVTGGPLAVITPAAASVGVDAVITEAGWGSEAQTEHLGGTDYDLIVWKDSEGTNRGAAIRFTLDVPAGATIESTVFRIHENAGLADPSLVSGSFPIRISCEDDSDPDWYTDYADFAGRTLSDVGSSASVAGTAHGGWVDFDISPVIQDVVDRPGWIAGNHLILRLYSINDFDPDQTDAFQYTGYYPGIGGLDGFEPTLGVIYTNTTPADADYYPVNIEFIGEYAGQDVPEFTIEDSTLDGTLSVSTTQEGGPATVENIEGGEFTLVFDTTSAGTFSVTVPYDVSASELETAIDEFIDCDVTGGPAPDNTLTVEINVDEPINVTLSTGLETNLAGSVTKETVREAVAAPTPENVWDLTVIPGEGTLGVDHNAYSYLVLKFSEPLTETPVLTDAPADNDVYIELQGINAERIEDAINEAFGRDIVRVTRIVHSQEWDSVVIGAEYTGETQEPVYFWYYKDVFRLVFCNEFAASGTITAITATTPPLSEENPDPAGPDAWLQAPVGVPNTSDRRDAHFESDRVYFGFVNRISNNPVHLFSCTRFEDFVDNRLSYKVKLLSQINEAVDSEDSAIKRAGIAKPLADQTITFSWVRYAYGSNLTETPTPTVLVSTPAMNWDASADEIKDALTSLSTGFFGDGNVIVRGSLFNSYLSESTIDLPDPLDCYNDLRIILTGKLAYLPLHDMEYALTCTLSNTMLSDVPQSRAFRCLIEPYSKPIPNPVNNRLRFTIDGIDDVTSVIFSLGDEIVTVDADATIDEVADELNTAFGRFAANTPIPAIFRNSVTLFGSDFNQPFEIAFTGYGKQYTNQALSVGTIATEEPITLTTTQEGTAPTPEIQVVSITGSPRSGTFTLTAPAGTTSSLDAVTVNAAGLEAALEALTGYASKITVTGTYPTFTVTFDSSLGNLATMTATLTGFTNASGTVTVSRFGGTEASLSIRESTIGKGPLYLDDSDNFDLGRVLSSGDTLVFDDATSPIRFGIEQKAEIVVASLNDNLFRYRRLRNVFKEGQKVLFRGTGTPPGGLTFSDLPDTEVYYYIVEADDNFTFKLSATEGGEAINVTSVGSGTFELVLHDIQILCYSRYSGREVGLPNRRSAAVLEYLPRYLTIAKVNLDLGVGDGDGVTLFRLDTLDQPATLLVRDSGQSSTTNIPAVLFLVNNDETTLEQQDGDVGIGVYNDEAGCLLKSITKTDGTLLLNGVTIIDPVDAPDQNISLRNCTFTSIASL